MKKIVGFFAVSQLLVGLAQTVLGVWTQQEISDPFVDERQVVLAISENGEAYEGSGPFFAVICRAGTVDVVYFNVAEPLYSNEARDFDYRVNGGEVATVEGWMNDGFVSLRSGEDDFAAFKEAVLVDDAEVAFAAVASSGKRVVTVFQLTGLDDALAATQCEK